MEPLRRSSQRTSSRSGARHKPSARLNSSHVARATRSKPIAAKTGGDELGKESLEKKHPYDPNIKTLIKAVVAKRSSSSCRRTGHISALVATQDRAEQLLASVRLDQPRRRPEERLPRLKESSTGEEKIKSGIDTSWCPRALLQSDSRQKSSYITRARRVRSHSRHVRL